MKNYIRSKLRRFLCLAAALLMLWPQTVTAGGAHHGGGKSYTVTQGGMLKIPLEEVFTDREGHALTYSVVNNDGNQSTRSISEGTYFFTTRTAGEYARWWLPAADRSGRRLRCISPWSRVLRVTPAVRL